MTRILVVSLLAWFASANVLADWPQFRGPNGSGVATDANPPIEFGPDKNLLWQLEIPSGHSSPVVGGDLIYMTTYVQKLQQLSVAAIDRHHGTIRWERRVDATEIERGHPSFNPASSTPVTDGERIVAYFGSYGLICFDLEGKQLWKVPLPLTKSYAGNAISPIIAGDKVILYRGNFTDHFLLAVEKHTGEELWRTPQSEPFHAELACTAIPIVRGDLLVLHGARAVQGFDIQTGVQRWITKCATTATSTPLFVQGRVIVAAWNKMGEPALRPEFPDFAKLVEDHDANSDGVIQQPEFPKLWIFQLTQKLKSWIVTRKAEANRDKTVAGAKYPHLCRFAEHLHAGLGDSLRIVSVDRDIEASIRSLQSRSEKHRGQWFAATDEQCEELQRSLLHHRDAFIAAHPDVPVFRIEFAELTTYPEEVIANLIEFLGIEPTEEEIASAIDHVNPDLRKHG